jgi:hypothetical protein
MKQIFAAAASEVWESGKAPLNVYQYHHFMPKIAKI